MSPSDTKPRAPFPSSVARDPVPPCRHQWQRYAHGVQSRCCGGGSGVRTAFMDFAQKTAVKRIGEAKKSGAEAIVTSCPFCEQNIGDALNSMNDEMEILDLTDVMIKAMDKRET